MMKQQLSRRDFLRASALTTAGLALAACAVPATTTQQPADTPADTAEAVPTPQLEVMGGGSMEINMWDGIGASDGLILTEMIKAFAEENQDITVKRQIMPWNVYFDKLAAAIVAGSGGPDLFVLWHSVVPQYARPGHLLPAADDMFDMGLLPKDDFPPQLIDAVTINGTAWTVPFDNYGVGVYVNKALLDQAGIDVDKPPQNQAEWLEYARALTWDKDGRHPGDSGFDPSNVDIWGWAIGWPRATVQAALYQWGGDIISRTDPPEVLINSEGSVAATQFFVDAVHTHHVAASPAGYNVGEDFANGKVAMWPNGSWHYNWFTQFPDVEAALWPYPTLGPERGSTLMWSHTFAMPKGIEPGKMEGAQRLVKYLSDHSDTWTRRAGMPTARLSLREGLMDDVWTLPVFDEQFRKEGVPEFSSPRFTEIMGAVEPEWSACLNGDKPVQQALDDAAIRIRRALDA
jgi:multiple sugar transport system substrate-binding protein